MVIINAGLVRTAAAAAALVAWMAANGCATDTDAPASHALKSAKAADGEWLPRPASATYEGKSLSQWAVDFMRWTFSWSDCDIPLYDPDGSHCAAFQREDSPVFHLSQGEALTDMSQCPVPSDKALLVPLIVFSLDNAGVDEAEQLSPDQLEEEAERAHSSMTDLRLLVDGQEVGDLEDYAVTPTRFSYELGPEPNFLTCYGYPGVTGAVDPAFVTGYFALLPPPPPGSHTLEYQGVVYVDDEAQDAEVAIANHVRMTFTIR